MKRFEDIWAGRDVTVLWIAQVLSQAGDSVYQIALMWLMLDLTGSKALTGLAAMSAYLPTLLFGILAGAVADRVNRRRAMMAADAARACLVAIVPLASWAGILVGGRGALILGCVTFAVACVATIFNPARDALVPDIAPPGKLTVANGLIQTSWQLAMFLGPSLAGLVIPFTGLMYLFRVNAGTYLLSMMFILLLPAAAGRLGHDGADAAGPGPSGRILGGLSYAWQDRRLRGLILVTAAYNFFLMGLPFVATPVYVREILHAEPEAYAWLQAIYAGGMVPGVALAWWLSRRIRPGRLILMGIVLDGLTYTPFFLVRSFPLAILFMGIHSMVIPLILVPRTTLVQGIAPREMWGRVFSMVSVSVVGFSALSAAVVGLVAEALPVPWIFLVFGCLSAVVGAAGFLDRSLRNAA